MFDLPATATTAANAGSGGGGGVASTVVTMLVVMVVVASLSVRVVGTVVAVATQHCALLLRMSSIMGATIRSTSACTAVVLSDVLTSSVVDRSTGGRASSASGPMPELLFRFECIAAMSSVPVASLACSLEDSVFGGVGGGGDDDGDGDEIMGTLSPAAGGSGTIGVAVSVASSPTLLSSLALRLFVLVCRGVVDDDIDRDRPRRPAAEPENSRTSRLISDPVVVIDSVWPSVNADALAAMPIGGGDSSQNCCVSLACCCDDDSGCCCCC